MINSVGTDKKKMTKTVTLNGKVYDANSGKVVDGIHKPAHVSKPHEPSHGRPAARSIHHKVQHSGTLMRNAVKKPSLHPKKHIESAASSTPASRRRQISLAAVSAQRIERAEKIHKSRLINRFSDIAPAAVHKKTEVVPVKRAPPEGISHHLTPPITGSVERTDIFAGALSQSTAHHDLPEKNTKRGRSSVKAFTISSMVVSVLLLSGFFAWQNSANIEFRMAASKAGVQAVLPSYRPAGFSFKGPVEFAPGEITVHFRSNSDERSFNLTQRASDWNSQALLENFVAARQNYHALEDKGKTVYVYDSSNATWVDGGIWYQIEGNSNLNTDQLLRLASSM